MYVALTTKVVVVTQQWITNTPLMLVFPDACVTLSKRLFFPDKGACSQMLLSVLAVS